MENNIQSSQCFSGDGILLLVLYASIIKTFAKNTNYYMKYFLIIEHNMVPTLLVKVCCVLIHRSRIILSAYPTYVFSFYTE